MSQENRIDKTQEELFEEINAARAAGTDYGKVLKNVNVSDSESNEDTVVPKEEAPLIEVPEVTEEVDTTKVTTEVTPAPVDWEAGLSPEVLAEVQKLKDERAQLEHRVKSELGRVPYLQRKVEELSRQTSQPPTPPVGSTAATKTSGKFAERLARAREVDPDLADLFEAAIEEISAPLREELTNEVHQTKQAIADKEYEELWQREKAKLLQQVPQADEVFKHPMYKQWKSEIPENLLRLSSSVYADEVVIALEQFAKYVALQSPETPASPQAPVAPAPVDTTASDKLAADRARKLSSGAPSTSAPAPRGGTGIPEDPDALFNYITDKIRKNEPYKL
jgi:hypothetical protein